MVILPGQMLELMLAVVPNFHQPFYAFSVLLLLFDFLVFLESVLLNIKVNLVSESHLELG